MSFNFKPFFDSFEGADSHDRGVKLQADGVHKDYYRDWQSYVYFVKNGQIEGEQIHYYL